jgi:hypothetical protein
MFVYYGPDEIPNRILKECASQITPSLTVIFQKSIDTGTLPEDWLLLFNEETPILSFFLDFMYFQNGLMLLNFSPFSMMSFLYVHSALLICFCYIYSKANWEKLKEDMDKTSMKIKQMDENGATTQVTYYNFVIGYAWYILGSFDKRWDCREDDV